MDLNKIYIYRITHIGNIEHVLKNGITHRNSVNANKDFIPIGDKSLIAIRDSKFFLKDKLLGDYIPFYFGVKSPMLYVIQNGYNGVKQHRAHNIVYIVSSVQKIIDSEIDFVYTDGHATNKLTSFYNKSNIKTIEEDLDFNAIHIKFWRDENDLDLKRRKEAEFLIDDDLPNYCVLGFVVFNEYARNEILKLGVDSKKIKIRANYYY